MALIPTFVDTQTGQVYKADPETGDALIDPEAMLIGATPRRVSHTRTGNQQKVRARTSYLGLGGATALAGATGTLVGTAQEPCILTRLLTDGDTAGFLITNILVGTKSMFSGTAGLPAGMFQPNVTHTNFKARMSMFVGQTVTLYYTNNASSTGYLTAGFTTLQQVV